MVIIYSYLPTLYRSVLNLNLTEASLKKCQYDNFALECALVRGNVFGTDSFDTNFWIFG